MTPSDADYYREFFDLGIEMLDVDDFNDAAPECVGKYGTRIDLYKPSDVPALLNLSATTISL